MIIQKIKTKSFEEKKNVTVFQLYYFYAPMM